MEENYLRDKSFGFEIAHVLRELGFRKESKFYYVKAGKLVGSFPMRQNNFWNFKHYDFNSEYRFVPSMGNPWLFNNHQNYPVFEKYNREGYLCTCPTFGQVNDFCKRWNIPLTDKENTKTILYDLIKFYRKKIHQETAFKKYETRVLGTDRESERKKQLQKSYWDILEQQDKWRREHLTEVRSITAESPRGAWFWYASLYDGHIYAIGEEQGNYAGGDLCSVNGGENRLKSFIEERLARAEPNSYKGSLYEKIKDLPIATFEMYQEMEKKLLEFDEVREKILLDLQK